MRGRRRRGIGHWVTNWERSDLPVPIRLLVAARNISIRVRNLDTCCGHDGEPGC
jgi:hypothetical protein